MRVDLIHPMIVMDQIFHICSIAKEENGKGRDGML